MKNRRRIYDILFVLIILFLALFSVFRVQQITKLNNASNLVVHTNLVKLKLTETIGLIKEAENRKQDSIQLEIAVFNSRLRFDSSHVFQKLHELDSLTHDNSAQQIRIQQLAAMMKNWLENLHAENIQAAQLSSDLAAYIRQGRTVVSHIEGLIRQMTNEEDNLLLERIQDKDNSAFFAPFYSLVFSFLAIIIITVIYLKFRNETQLRQKAELAREIIHNFFHQAPAMLAILKGPRHVFEFVNPPFLELIGGRNPVNLPVSEALPEAVGQGYIEILDSVYQTGEPFIGREMPIQLDRGRGIEPIFINFICQILKNASGKTDGILVFCYDVSGQVHARNQLQEAESRSRMAIEATHMGTFDWDMENQQFISSERLVEIFGYRNASQVTHKDLIGRLHPDDKPIRDEAVNNSIALGSLRYEARIIWPDKSIHWISVLGKIMHNDTRKILRMYGTVLDITQQKIALEEIRESEAKFRLLASAMPQLIWTTDKSGNLNYFNQAVFDYSGLSFEELRNKGWLSIVHADELKENIRRWFESIHTGTEFIFEHRFRNYKGEYRWQLSRAIPRKDDEGNIHMWIGTSTDIQEQKNFMQELEKQVSERTQSLNMANLELNKTVSELEESNAELASFNYIASHDLQEPLRKIIAFSKHVGELENKTLSASSRDYFDRIINAASRMQNLINAFLSYSQASNLQAAFEMTDLNIILREVKDEFAETIQEKKIIFDEHPLPLLMAIPLQINQLFTNLLSNAIKYSRPAVIPRIEVSAEKVLGSDLLFEEADKKQPYWKITICDNGIGFDQIHEFQIFELFQRLHSRQEYAGTGIGLAICKKIMRNHKGFITASGQTGSGAVFSMYFPFSSDTDPIKLY
jgi:PAS domain S-box-containing protein